MKLYDTLEKAEKNAKGSLILQVGGNFVTGDVTLNNRDCFLGRR